VRTEREAGLLTETVSPPHTGTAARAVDAYKIYGSGEAAVHALNGITVSFESARLTAIMGPSGSGKSTLLHCLAGLDRLTSGQIFLGSTKISECSEKELTLIRRDKLGFIFQAYNLIPTLNALENMTLPMSLAGTKPDSAWLDTVVNTVRLQDRLTHRPAELSGGQQQRVAVGRALLSRPEVVFADEPTGNLDSRSSTEILTFMRGAVDDLNQTIVMVTHDPVAASYANRVVFLVDGAIVDELLDPTAQSVLDKMKSLGVLPGPGVVHESELSELSPGSFPSTDTHRRGVFMPDEHTTAAGTDTPRHDDDFVNWSPNEADHAVARDAEAGRGSHEGGEAAVEALALDLLPQELAETNGGVLIDDRITKLETDRDHWRKRAVVWQERAVAAEQLVKMLERNLDDLRANVEDLRVSTRPALGSSRGPSASHAAWRRWCQDLSSKYFPRGKASHRVTAGLQPVADLG
jgi:putative ABC transport system ATP-binding protein